jgi:acyl-CoA reductase-like NAD-dependent aldehyde dehydrogenase
MTLETGKPLVESLAEVSGSADIFEWNAEETKRIYGQTVQSSQTQRVVFQFLKSSILPIHYFFF